MGRLRGKWGNLTICDGAVRRSVCDYTIRRADLVDRHAPRLCGRQQQSLAGFSAGKLKIIAAVLD
jgi:hypothetical protein